MSSLASPTPYLESQDSLAEVQPMWGLQEEWGLDGFMSYFCLLPMPPSLCPGIKRKSRSGILNKVWAGRPWLLNAFPFQTRMV